MINLRSPSLVLPVEPCPVAHTLINQSVLKQEGKFLVEIVLDFKRCSLTTARHDFDISSGVSHINATLFSDPRQALIKRHVVIGDTERPHS